jgi:hypothetical protein
MVVNNSLKKNYFPGVRKTVWRLAFSRAFKAQSIHLLQKFFRKKSQGLPVNLTKNLIAK